MSPNRQALLSLYHDDATALLARALQAQHEPEGLHVVHAALVEALADAHTDGREPGVSTTVPDETIAAIEARLNAATPGDWRTLDAFGTLSIWADARDRVTDEDDEGDVEIAFVEGRHAGNADLIAHAPEDLRALLAEVRRLTDANARLTDLVRHQRGALHTEGLITDAEYAALAGMTGSPARLEGYDALRGELALQKRATNVAIGERDQARTALATARLDGARAVLREVEARAEGVAERHEGLAKAARAKDDRNRATAKQAAAEAVFGAIREIRAIDPAAVVGSGS